MEPWILITLGAAFAQTLRFMLQKHLKSTRLSTAGATFARFIYSAPLVAVIAIIYAQISGQGSPDIPAAFWPYMLMGGTSQILATMCVVALFAHRNFAVGITFKKTEVLLSALFGFLILGDMFTWPAILAICIGFVGVLLLADTPGGDGPWRKRILSRSTALGLGSGILFGISGNGYRGASLSLGDGDVFYRAIITLACVTAFQTLTMAVWLVWRERGEITKVIGAWRVAGLVGLTSMAGSICWFTAFTLQNAAYVNAVGQIELLFSLIIGAFVFGEKVGLREWQGLLLLTSSIGMLVLVT
ncbi:DMT family transporter [Yoonia sediminilitoris]|uniref:EamA-like transporter family protein n=1 Tax=Yoonia sediminilitoris TaxID=1286148 RepID=A0A2T6KB59_9RHOB|nr:DMT family transporter [Yoonia sediminilitoris]PUB12088.1 EamA-like transporter family protein [Yoonia sediminilitoris]RCW92915.1 EamA-like transporter family protein [Yoonia sediminilitoris]